MLTAVQVILATEIDKEDSLLLGCVSIAVNTLTNTFIATKTKEDGQDFCEIIYCKDHKLAFISLGLFVIVLPIDKMNKLQERWGGLVAKYNITSDKEKDKSFENFMNNLMDSPSSSSNE